MQNNIKEKLKSLPLCPGVYIMKDADQNIIYVGKSKVLKNRVSQYFQSSMSHTPKTLAMVSKIRDFEYIVTDTESEALALECTLIKKHKPKYNILLKDDKQYPYVKITSGDEFPRMFVTRQIKKDKSTYLGPYTETTNLKSAVEEIRKIFHIRNCSKTITEKNFDQRPCLYYQIGQCSAPCCGKISKEDYKISINQAISVLNGNYKKITNELKTRMENASKALEFEKAADIRDRILYIESLSEHQKVASASNKNMDFWGVYQENDNYCVQILFYRNGNAVKSEYFTFKSEQETQNSVLESFVKQFYFTKKNIPGQIYISNNLDDCSGIEEWLSKKSGHKVSFILPQRGTKAEIIEMVIKNAQESLYKELSLSGRNEAYQNRMLAKLKELLVLKEIPTRIEIYDISNFSGASAVGAEVVYKNAAPTKKLYRKYNIKTVQGADDYESMREVINRRICEAYKEEDLIKSGNLKVENAKFLPLPNLIFLDGGKGHVDAIKPILETLGEEIPVFGLVKDGSHKTRGITDGTNELRLDKSSELYKFLACMQDEVHRYAIMLTRKKHEKSTVKSQLEKIPMVGPETRKKLLLHFGSLKSIKTATKDELLKVVSEKTAKNILEFFQKENL